MRVGLIGLFALLAAGQGSAPAQTPPPDGRGGVTPPLLAPSLEGDATPAAAQPPEQLPPPMPRVPDDVAPAHPEYPRDGAPLSPEELRWFKLRRDHHGPRERFWLTGGPLLWWVKDGPAPGPLATTGSAISQGALGQPDTRILLGNDTLDFGRFTGGRVRGGLWLNSAHTWGVEAGGFLLEERSVGVRLASDASGFPLLARPITNVTNPLVGSPIGVVVASPGVLAGGIDFAADSQLAGAEVSLVRNLVHCREMSVDLLAGFRYLDLDENLLISHTSQIVSAAGQLAFAGMVLPPLSQLTVSDRFNTRNQFYGGQIGGRVELWRGPAFLRLLGKVAFGPNHETIKITGSTTATTPDGVSNTATGGLLAVAGNRAVPVIPGVMFVQPTNLGRNTTNWFVIVPQAEVEVGLQVSDAVRLAAGYSFLYVNNVARPGSQVNRNVNPAFVPSSLAFGSPSGPAEPRALTRQDDFWAQGFSLSVEVRY